MNRFLRFCVVGTIGFLIDAGILQLLVTQAETNPYTARLVSFFVAASSTWFLNRHFTFQVAQRPSGLEWFRYVCVMVCGACVNYGVYAACVTFWPAAALHPWYGVAAGSIAGLGINFSLSRLLFLSK